MPFPTLTRKHANIGKGFLFSLCALQGYFLWLKLRAFNDPPGLNGYFYLKQAKTLAFDNSFYFSDHSLFYWPLAALTKLLSSELYALQYMVSFVVSALLASLLLLFFSLRPKASAPMAAVFVATIVLGLNSSSLNGEFNLNFFKNSFGLVFVFLSMVALLQAKTKSAILLFAVSFFTHKSAALFGAIFLGLLFAKNLLKAYQTKKLPLRFLAILTSLLVLFSLLFLWHFPKAHAFVDHLTHIWQSPFTRLHWFRQLTTENHGRSLEILTTLLLGTIYLSQRRKHSSAHQHLGDGILVFILLALHPFQSADESALPYRLTLMIPLASSLLLALHCTNTSYLVKIAAVSSYLLATPIHLSVTSFSWPLVTKEIRPYAQYGKWVQKIPDFVSAKDHITTHHGMEFYVDYVTNIRARSFVADKGTGQKLFRLAWAPEQRTGTGPVRDELRQSAFLDIASTYFLTSEEDWKTITKEYNLPKSWRNPTLTRPDHVYQ